MARFGLPSGPRRCAVLLLVLLAASLVPAISLAAPVEISGPAVITVPGTYVLSQEIMLHGGRAGIEVMVGDVTIDGNGHAIRGENAPGSCGVLVHSPAGRVRNVTVKDLDLRDLEYGTYFWNTDGGGMEGCRVVSCDYGITFNPGIRGNVTACRLERNHYGIAFSGRSSSPRVVSNRVTDSVQAGLYLYQTRGGRITDNYLSNNRNVFIGAQVSGINWTAGPRAGRSIAAGPSQGGNFWGRPSGRGFSQTTVDADQDGFCDRTYPVAGYMVDKLPLRAPIDVTAPVAGFTASPASGTAPLVVRFNETSRGDAAVFDWSFGDGTGAVTRNPTHVYPAPGRYNVTLRVADPGGENVSVRTRQVTVTAPLKKPAASFRAAPRSGPAPLAVQFTDTSSGSPREWRWTFGDGSISTEQNPRHVFRRAGTYSISLRVSNAAGASTRTATRSVTVIESS
ncbi:MAG: PKD domain-containing protein [Methanoregulaceae archaeon]